MDLLTSIKYAENGVFFWFPGSGTTTVLKDTFAHKPLLTKELGKLSEQIKVFEVFGHIADKKTSSSLFESMGFASFSDLKTACLNELDQGYELVYLIGRIDDFTEKEKLDILKQFLKLSAFNPRRVHLQFHTIDKPWFLKMLSKHPELMLLTNRMQTMPILKGKLLDEYIEQRAQEFGYKVSEPERIQIAKTYGGILQLTKEFLRAHGNTKIVELKLKVLWSLLPKAYCEFIQAKISNNKPSYQPDITADLHELGVFDLKLFSEHQGALFTDSAQTLQRMLTMHELKLWQYLQRHNSELISRDIVIDLLRPENADEITFWALDKAVSRFRIKLAKSGIDPDLLKTVKGKGYIWQK